MPTITDDEANLIVRELRHFHAYFCDAPTPDEVIQQRIIGSHDFRRLHVFYVLATFGLSAYRPAHVLCKVEGWHGRKLLGSGQGRNSGLSPLCFRDVYSEV